LSTSLAVYIRYTAVKWNDRETKWGEKMSDDNDGLNEEHVVDLVIAEDFESWYDSDAEVVGINFLEDGVTKEITKEDFRNFYKFMSQTYDEFLRAEDED